MRVSSDSPRSFVIICDISFLQLKKQARAKEPVPLVLSAVITLTVIKSAYQNQTNQPPMNADTHQTPNAPGRSLILKNVVYVNHYLDSSGHKTSGSV
jgi:hypothetical protein